LIFGLPIERNNGEIYKTGQASIIAAQCVANAELLTFMQYKNDIIATKYQIQYTFINYMKLMMLNYGGRVDRSGTGSPLIKIKEAEYDW
jgi:hypothetical protein